MDLNLHRRAYAQAYSSLRSHDLANLLVVAHNAPDFDHVILPKLSLMDCVPDVGLALLDEGDDVRYLMHAETLE